MRSWGKTEKGEGAGGCHEGKGMFSGGGGAGGRTAERRGSDGEVDLVGGHLSG